MNGIVLALMRALGFKGGTVVVVGPVAPVVTVAPPTMCKHRSYRAIRKPRTDCTTCAAMYSAAKKG